MREPAKITPDLVAQHGITPDEYQRIFSILGREPNFTELGIFSVMWSEHCSYKSSRVHLKTLPTEGPCILQGPGENAGVVDIGSGLAIVFKMESHNHPSFIEPHQGAATGVGGIIRDIFTMGARPIALLDPLRFGPLTDVKSRFVAGGVVAGISAYGNAVGVPTVGGELFVHETYAGNPLVNVFCLGIAPKDRIFLARASGEGNPVIYVGAKTGRAAVLFTAGYTDRMPAGLLRPVASLPLAVFFQLGTPYPEVQQRAYASALVLTIMVLLISLGSRLLARRLSRNVVK